MRNKYGAVKTTVDGQIYDSKMEAHYARQLDMLLKSKQIIAYKRQVKFPLHVNGVKVCDYIADFVVENIDKVTEVVEVKGMWTSTARLKAKMFQAEYPMYRYTVVGTPLRKKRRLPLGGKR